MTSNTRWISGDTADGFYSSDGFCFSDCVTEWIEEIVNKEYCQGSAYGDGCGDRLSRAPDSNRFCRELVGSLRAVRPIVESDRTARTSAAPRRGTAPWRAQPVSARSPSPGVPTRS